MLGAILESIISGIVLSILWLLRTNPKSNKLAKKREILSNIKSFNGPMEKLLKKLKGNINLFYFSSCSAFKCTLRYINNWDSESSKKHEKIHIIAGAAFVDTLG